jgi:diguanylate cyclase (GGDEF)-like protein
MKNRFFVGWPGGVVRAAACALLAAGMVAASAAGAPAEPGAKRWALLTDLVFAHLTQDNGLPNEIATAVAEDGDGFLWVGTLGGLARWDGYRFRVFKSDARNPAALPDNVVQTLHCDAVGRLWIGTSAGGLSRYDRDADRFVNFSVGPQGLSHVNVRAIVDDGAGGLWVGTDGGLDHVDPAAGTIRHVGADERVHSLLLDRAGRLWVGTPRGLFRKDAAGQRLEAIRLLAGNEPQPEPQTLFEDSRGQVWAGTLQHGAFVIEPGAAEARPVQETPAGGPPLQIQQVIDIAEARPGEVWLGTLGQGIVAVDTANRQTRRIRHQPTLPSSLADNAIRGLQRDRSGLLWVATNRGVSRHDPGQQAVLTMFGAPLASAGTLGGPAPASTEVSWILPMPDGRIWLGTHKNGIDIIDPSGKAVAGLRPDASRPAAALPQDIVLGLARTPDGAVLIGTKRGLYRAAPDAKRVERLAVGARDPKAATWSLLVDGGTLWLGGMSDGLWKMDLASGAAEPLLRDAAARLTDQRVMVLEKDSGASGALWIGTRHGLNRYEPKSGALTRIVPDAAKPDGLSAGFITTLFTDRRSRLWIGTYGGGINLLDAGVSPPRFRHLTMAQGLPDDNINAVLEDRAGRIWVSTDNGLALVDPDTLAVRALRRAEGVVFPTYWTGSAALTADGELLFGGAGGMTIVRPDLLGRPWSHRPKVMVTDLRVGGLRLPASRYVDGAGDPLTINADANSLAVEFAALDYSAPERNRYAYRLEGFDADWIDSDASRRLAAYNNLPPGDYRLLLRGSNREGDWTEQALALPLRVLPAWYQTLWFRVLALLAGIGALYAIVQARTRFLRASQLELEHKVQERTAMLEEVSAALREKSRVLELASICDPLTGLHNRRFLADHMEIDSALSLRRAQGGLDAAGAPPADADMVFLLVDADHFKRINDVYGHAAGDAVLVQLGERLKSVMRESDYVVRWGGEEFLAVVRHADRRRGDEVAERIRGVVADAVFVLDDGREVPVSCSVGFAAFPFIGGEPAGLPWNDVVNLADLALLAAKRMGRNCWVGLHAGENARADGLLARAQHDAQRALRSGELRTSSNKSAEETMDALAWHHAGRVRALPGLGSAASA